MEVWWKGVQRDGGVPILSNDILLVSQCDYLEEKLRRYKVKSTSSTQLTIFMTFKRVNFQIKKIQTLSKTISCF